MWNASLVSFNSPFRSYLFTVYDIRMKTFWRLKCHLHYDIDKYIIELFCFDTERRERKRLITRADIHSVAFQSGEFKAQRPHIPRKEENRRRRRREKCNWILIHLIGLLINLSLQQFCVNWVKVSEDYVWILWALFNWNWKPSLNIIIYGHAIA